MKIRMDYGRQGLKLDVPETAEFFLVREMAPLTDEVATIRDALRHPIGTRPLSTRLRPGMTVAVIHTDITRAHPMTACCR